MNHKEAFCLMQYQCHTCNHITNIWNSRDGVTPFMAGSRCCEGATLRHGNWQLDRHCPNLPDIASHVFIDVTRERAEESAQSFWDNNGEYMMTTYPHLREIGKEKLIAEKIKEIYGKGNNPSLVTRAEYLAS